MTPQEKAKELVLKYASTSVTTYGCGAAIGNPCLITNVMLSNSCKQCALIAVDELIQQCWDYREIDLEKSCDYWKQVKHELNKSE